MLGMLGMSEPSCWGPLTKELKWVLYPFKETQIRERVETEIAPFDRERGAPSHYSLYFLRLFFRTHVNNDSYHLFHFIIFLIQQLFKSQNRDTSIIPYTSIEM